MKSAWFFSKIKYSVRIGSYVVVLRFVGEWFVRIKIFRLDSIKLENFVASYCTVLFLYPIPHCTVILNENIPLNSHKNVYYRLQSQKMTAAALSDKSRRREVKNWQVIYTENTGDQIIYIKQKSDIEVSWKKKWRLTQNIFSKTRCVLTRKNN